MITSWTLPSITHTLARNFFALCTILLAPLALFVFFVTRWPKPRPVEPRRAIAFRPSAVPDKIDTIVIGSGSGGSTCANLLAQSGQRVLVLEQHDKTGGCTHSFRENNCEFDSGLHYTSKAISQATTRPGAIMDFMSRGKQEFTPLDDPYDEILFPAKEEMDSYANVARATHQMPSYRFISGQRKNVESIVNQINKDDVQLKFKANAWMDLCQDIHKGFIALGISRILPNWLHFLVKPEIDRLMTFASMTVRDVQHAVFNLGLTPEKLARLRVCPKAPDGYDSDHNIRRIKGVLCHPIGDYAVQPRDATMAAHGVTMVHYIDGGSYTVGPTQNISIRNSSVVRSYGGEVMVDATVREIIVEHGRAVGVRVSNTSELNKCTCEEEKSKITFTEIRAKNIVCATSIFNLYDKLLPQDLPVVKKFHDPKQRSVRQSNGHMFLFCKIKGDATDLCLPTHNLWYFHRYDVDTAFDEYFANPTEVRPPTVYIGFPCTKDVTWKKRFPNVSNCILISDGLYEWFEKWANQPQGHRGQDYEDFKAKFSNHLLDILYECVPQVNGKVEYYELGTPLSEITYLASFHGGSYGTQCTPSMFDPINRQWTTTPHTAVPGLYLAGSDAFLPSVVGAMYGGVLGACAVLGQLGSLRLGHALLCHLAKRLQQDNPKLSWAQAYCGAIKQFMK